MRGIMNLPELLKNTSKTSFSQREAANLSGFLKANAERIDYYQINDWNGDTYVILKWPHKVPELKVLP
jgi:hypothetical protein